MLERLVRNLATAVMAVDARRPVAVNSRSGVPFEPGLGPHSEIDTFTLILEEARQADPEWLLDLTYSVPYPANKRQRCDVRLATQTGHIFVEGKLLRLKGDNGKPNDNMLMHILSPYPQHRSLLTDCIKLRASGFDGPTAVMIVGYGYPDKPLEPAIEAFEVLARTMGRIGKRHDASFTGLCHRVHCEGKDVAWQVG
jgi:hypothetical protein